MIIEKLFLRNFRNINFLDIDFDQKINIFSGDNGSGKTNIIEALYILGNIKSFRSVKDENLVQWGEQGYYIKSISHTDGRSIKNEIAFVSSPERTKKIKINDMLAASAFDYYGSIPTVLFSPDDIHLVEGPPETKRRYIDSIISKNNREYFRALLEFRHILKSRNTVLRKIKMTNSNAGELDIWDELFSKKSVYIIKNRKEFALYFESIFRNNYNCISGCNDSPVLKYETDCETTDTSDIIKKLEINRKKDISAGLTSIGPQKDNYVLKNDREIHFVKYGSQGQKRIASISLKLTEKKMIEELRNERSIVLIDDIYSELDKGRKLNLMDHLGSYNQLFYTVADEKNIIFDKINSGSLFRVDTGTVKGCNEI